MLDGKKLKLTIKNETTLLISNISPDTDEIDLLNITGGKMKVRSLEMERKFRRDININVGLMIEKIMNE